MLRSQDDENIVVKWAFFEIINYLKETNVSWSQKWINDFLTTTKTHKILFNAFEKADIPVTRSWYRYGCFIHSNELSRHHDFSALRNRFINTKKTSLRDKAQELGIDVIGATEAIIEATEAMPQRVDDYIEALYCSDVPSGLGPIYQSKFNLAKLLQQIKVTIGHNQFAKWLPEIRRSFSNFQIAAISNPWFNELNEITTTFTSDVEQALLKTQDLINHERLFLRQINCLDRFHNFFDSKIWLPFALKTSAKTVKGIRAEQICVRQLEKQGQEIRTTTLALSELSHELADMNLTLNWTEYSNIIRHSHNDANLRNAVSELENLYDKTAQ